MAGLQGKVRRYLTAAESNKIDILSAISQHPTAINFRRFERNQESERNLIHSARGAGYVRSPGEGWAARPQMRTRATWTVRIIHHTRVTPVMLKGTLSMARP